MLGFGKSTFAKKRRAKQLGSKCPNCVRLTCNKLRCKTLRMVSVNREDKIKFVKDGMSKESLDDLLKRIRANMFNVKFIIYESFSKRRVHSLVLGI